MLSASTALLPGRPPRSGGPDAVHSAGGICRGAWRAGLGLHPIAASSSSSSRGLPRPPAEGPARRGSAGALLRAAAPDGGEEAGHQLNSFTSPSPSPSNPLQISMPYCSPFQFLTCMMEWSTYTHKSGTSFYCEHFTATSHLNIF